MKKLPIATLAVAAVFADPSAFAAPAACLSGFQPLSYFTGIGIYDPITDTGGCRQQNRIWDNFSFTGPIPSFSLARLLVENLHSVSNYRFQLSLEPTALQLDSPASFTYTVRSKLANVNNKIYVGVDIDSPAVDTQYTAVVDGNPNYTITNPGGIGGLWASASVPGDARLITATQTWSISPTGQLTAIDNSYQSGNIPEINALAGTGALTLLGGSLALAGERRRRKT